MLQLNTIHQGNCLELLPKIDDKSIDLIIIDPPYNIGKDKWDKIDNYLEFMQSVFLQCERVLKDNADERKQHYSVIFSGENNPMYDKTHNETTRKKIGLCSLLWHAHKRNETNLIYELQEQYLELYGEYNSKYPHY